MFFDIELYNLFLILLLELLLGFDNIVIISILVNRYSKKRLLFGIGLFLALFLRFIVLFSLTILSTLKKSLFWGFDYEDLIFFIGGAFLIYRGIMSIIEFLHDLRNKKNKGQLGIEDKEIPLTMNIFVILILQIFFLDFVFSVDSILVAIAITNHIMTIIIAFFLNILAILVLCNSIIKFLTKYRILNLFACIIVVMLGCKMLLKSFDILHYQYYLYILTILSAFVLCLFYIKFKRINE